RKNAGNTTETMSSRSALLQRLDEMHKQDPNMPVMVSADKEIKYDEVIQVVSGAKKIGINRVGLATKQ
ncbi:MAG: biopolymer transporter ExbD, partial [Paucimonas sp.]|nr:biopolymer transporter ExbD [Paucimonas sp.]